MRPAVSSPRPSRYDWPRRLEELQFAHLRGDGDAARTALSVCAVTGLPMPRWLAEIVLGALGKLGCGEEDTALGLGSEATRVRLGKRHRERRDEGIAQAYKFYREEMGRPASEVIESLSDYGLSESALKKAIWPKKSPTKKKKRRVR